jgi:transposase-like protein
LDRDYVDFEIWLEVVDWRFLKARGVPSQQDDTTSRRAYAGGKETPRYAKTTPRRQQLREEIALDLDEIARAGAKRMLAEALEAEVREYLEAARGERDEHGRALVVRNGHARERQVILGAGAVEVKAPRVNDRRVDEDGNRHRFKSVILPPYMRRSPKVTEVLPLLYLHGLSSGDFVPALEEFFGSEAGLSAATVTRLTEHWQIERESFMRRDLSSRDYVYIWG